MAWGLSGWAAVLAREHENRKIFNKARARYWKLVEARERCQKK